MQSMTLTTAEELKVGDVFRRTKFRTEVTYTVTHAPDYQVGHILATKEGLHWPDPISKKEEVIFLNHKNQKNASTKNRSNNGTEIISDRRS